MSDIAMPMPGKAPTRPDLNPKVAPTTAIIFILLLASGLLFTAYSLYNDIKDSGVPLTTRLPFLLLGAALLIALGFEFVNGFHDAANAVATVIYTHSLPAQLELILQVGSEAGFAMVFALLFAAIIWNLGTWYLGLPASSSHTLIGSIIGVGFTNALLRGRDGTSGVDWTKATEIFYSLLLSPMVGFFVAALLLLVLKVLVRNRSL
jgi:inorganic phosphate transporter, PiT family